MVILNFFGDFLAPSVDGLSIGANLKRIFDNGSYNVVETKDYIERVNQTLSDDSEYMNYINRVCDNILESYYNLFLAGVFFESQ